MPQFAPIAVSYGSMAALKATTFEPLMNEKGMASYVGSTVVTDTTTGVSTGPATAAALQPTVTISLSRPSKTSRISKARVKLVIPVAALDAVGNPTNVKSHENSADTTFLFSEKSTEVERDDLDFCFQGLLQSDDFFAVIHKLKSMY